MNTQEMKLLLPLLRMIESHLSYEGCNDHELPNTPVGLSLWTKINQWKDPDDNDEWTLTDMTKDTLFTVDFTLVEYLMYCIENDLIEVSQ